MALLLDARFVSYISPKSKIRVALSVEIDLKKEAKC